MWALVALSLMLAAPAPVSPPPTLTAAVARLYAFDDDGAQKILLALLASHPADPVAARCHLYLGLIAINRVDTARALAEFKTTLRLDLTVEPTMDFSPKGRQLFDRARREVELEVPTRAPPPAVGPVASPAAPALVAAPLVVVAAPAEPPSKLPAYLTGGVAVAALATGTVFGVLANSSLSDARANASGPLATQQLSTAKTDAILADVLWPAGGAIGVVAIILFITELAEPPEPADSKATTPVANLGLAPTSGGAVAFLTGRF